jgi:hypothetical protein
MTNIRLIQFNKNRKRKIEKLFDKILSDLEGWKNTFLEEGNTEECALLSAHDCVKAKYRSSYQRFNLWLDKEAMNVIP